MLVRSHLGVVGTVAPQNGGQCAYFLALSIVRIKGCSLFRGRGG